MELFTKPTGTDDFLPEQMVQRNYVERTVRETFESFGYTQIQTPLFESFDLLSAQAGEEIRHKMFTFVGPDRVDYALRPELTAPVCRIIANGDLGHLPFPYKLYYIGQCVRKEPRTDSVDVRYEFRQAGIELIGPTAVYADAEIITLPVRVIEKLNIADTKLKIGNTGIFREIFKQIPLDTKDQSEVIFDLDHLSRLRMDAKNLDVETLRNELNTLRRTQGVDYQGEDKIDAEDIQALTENTMSEWIENLPRIAEETYMSSWERNLSLSKEISQRCIDISKISGDKDTVIAAWDTHLGGTGLHLRQELIDLCDCLENSGITDYALNLGITRGFDFYTGTVFQIEYQEKNLTICGGGRYDHLIESFGGPSLPGAGFAFQFDALMQAFSETQEDVMQNSKDYFIATDCPELQSETQQLADRLRRSGKTAEVDLMNRSMQGQYEYALNRNYTYLLRLTANKPMCRIDLKTDKIEEVPEADL